MGFSTTKSKYVLHFTIENSNIEQIDQNSALNLLLCVRDNITTEYKILNIITSISAQTVELDLLETVGTVSQTRIEYCIVGYFILRWYSELSGLTDIELARYANDLSDSNKLALIEKIKILPNVNWITAHIDGAQADVFELNDKPIYNTAFSFTGDVLGADIDPTSNISLWSLGNLQNRWRNVYTDKLISNFAYSDRVISQQNYVANIDYLKAYWAYIPYGGEPYKTYDPVNLIDTKINNPKEMINFEQTDITDPENFVYYTTIEDTKYYIDLEKFVTPEYALSQSTLIFKLYLDKELTTESGIILERATATMYKYTFATDTFSVTYNEAECVYKEIKIGNRTRHWINASTGLVESDANTTFYCHNGRSDDNNIYCHFDPGYNGQVQLSDPLVLQNTETGEWQQITILDLITPNLTYTKKTKVVTTVGVSDQPYEEGYINELHSNTIKATEAIKLGENYTVVAPDQIRIFYGTGTCAYGHYDITLPKGYRAQSATANIYQVGTSAPTDYLSVNWYTDSSTNRDIVFFFSSHAGDTSSKISYIIIAKAIDSLEE